MKIQRQRPPNLCIEGPAVHCNLWEDYATEPEVEKSKMVGYPGTVATLRKKRQSHREFCIRPTGIQAYNTTSPH